VHSLLLLWLLVILSSSGRSFLLLSEAGSNNLLLTLFKVSKTALDFVEGSNFLEEIVHIAERVTEVGVHHALLKFS